MGGNSMKTVAHVYFCRLATLDDLVPLQQLSGLTQLGLEGNPCCNLHPISRFRIEVLARHCTSLQLMDSHKVWLYLSQMTNEPMCDWQAFAVGQSMSTWQLLHAHAHSRIMTADNGKGMYIRYHRHLPFLLLTLLGYDTSTSCYRLLSLGLPAPNSQHLVC